MTDNEMGGSWSLSASEMERILDRAVDGLSRMDSEVLSQLAGICHEWDSRGTRMVVSHAERARLSWKLLLLDRLLRQTRTNLNVLGFRPGQYPPRDNHPNRVGR